MTASPNNSRKPYLGNDASELQKAAIHTTQANAQQQLLTELMSHKDQLLTWKKDDGSEVVYVPVSILEAKLKQLRDGENK